MLLLPPEMPIEKIHHGSPVFGDEGVAMFVVIHAGLFFYAEQLIRRLSSVCRTLGMGSRNGASTGAWQAEKI